MRAQRARTRASKGGSEENGRGQCPLRYRIDELFLQPRPSFSDLSPIDPITGTVHLIRKKTSPILDPTYFWAGLHCERHWV